MARELTITMRVRNAIAAGVKSVENTLNGMATGIGNAFRTASRWVLGVGVAVAGVAAKAIAAWSESERATTSLKSAFRAYGEEVDANTAKMQAYAQAVQEETGVDDDVTVARMARLKMLGMETAMLGPASKGVIALAEAGMDETAAMKALVAAQEGEYGALGRYLPLLKSATTEAEKAAIVNDFLTRGYQASKDRLETVGGAWAMLKTRVGNAWEELGKVLAQDAGLQAMLKTAGDKIKELTQRFAEWAASGGVTNLIAGVKLFAEGMRNSFTVAGIYAKGFFVGGLVEPGKQAWQYVSGWAKAWFELMAAGLEYTSARGKAFWEKMKAPWKDFVPPSTDRLSKALEGVVDAAKGGTVEASKAFDDMFASLESEEARSAAARKAISDKQLADLAANNQKRVADEVNTMEQIVIAAENNAKEIAELQKKYAEQTGAIAEEEGKQAAEAEKKRAEETKQAELDAAKKKADASAKTAAMTVKEFMDAQQAGKDEKAQAKADAGRQAKLEAKIGRGTTLKDSDAAWLAARKAIEDAKNQAAVDAGEALKIQNDLDAMRLNDSDNLKRMRIAAEETSGKLDALMRAKGGN